MSWFLYPYENNQWDAEPSTSAGDSQPTLHDLENIIEEGEALRKASYRETGKALHEIKSHGLFKETHRTWQDYLRKRWGFSRQRAHQLMQAWTEAETSTAVDIAKTEREARRRSLTDPAETPAGGEIQQACGLPTDTAAFVRPSLRAREVYGLRHTSKPYGEGGLYTLHTYKRDHNRISVGIAVVEQGPNEGDPMIELHLEVRTDDCPHIRQVIFEHSIGYILTCCDYGGLEEYLKACCPSDYQEALEVIALAFMDRLAYGWE